jgi:hypothetical protein
MFNLMIEGKVLRLSFMGIVKDKDFIYGLKLTFKPKVQLKLLLYDLI